ncbi:MAG: hypothetical protein IPN29_16115 [Saprospiraceae bacterium]|nr:hypothetical protein [Saprospiraceae bacterium]
MKKLFFLSLIISVFACKNVEQYKAGIEEIGTKWEAATASVNEFSTMVEGSKAAFTAAFDSLKIDSTYMSKLKGADLDKVKMAVEAYQASGAGLDEVAGQLAEFKSGWEAKAGEITTLKDGLAAGKLEGDITGKIAELTNFLATSETQLTTWKDAIAKTSEGSTAALEALKAAVMPMTAKKK